MIVGGEWLLAVVVVVGVVGGEWLLVVYCG